MVEPVSFGKTGLQIEKSPLCPLCQGLSQLSFVSVLKKGGEKRLSPNSIKEKSFSYYFCSFCDWEFLWPQLSDEELVFYYPQEDYGPYQSPKKKEDSILKKWTLQAIYGYPGPKRPLFAPLLAKIFQKKYFFPPHILKGKALEIGPGNGRLLSFLSQLGWEIEGVEWNPSVAAKLQKAGYKVKAGTLEQQNYPDQRFDLVVALHVVEHLRNPLAFFKEVSRILKPNGWLWIETPNRKAFGRKLCKSFWMGNDPPRHFFLFSPKSFQILSTLSNLQIYKIQSPTRPKYLLKSLEERFSLPPRSLSRSKVLRNFIHLLATILVGPHGGDELHILFQKKKNT
ncbi:MAG: class I SAM-dependent methyltransferase [Planctomycetota bacterium]|nr:MAG: class I SAM-dependent methyltransferase [Planctomycetota bacterium]